jgi:hypothetical protein
MREVFLAFHGGEFSVRVREENGRTTTLASECGNLEDALQFASVALGGPVGIRLTLPPPVQALVDGRRLLAGPPTMSRLRDPFDSNEVFP